MSFFAILLSSGATTERVDVLDNTTSGPWIDATRQVQDFAFYVILFWNVLCLLTIIFSFLFYFFVMQCLSPRSVYIKNDKKATVDGKTDHGKIRNILKIGEKPDIYVVHLSDPLSDKKNG